MSAKYKGTHVFWSICEVNTALADLIKVTKVISIMIKIGVRMMITMLLALFE